MRPPNKKPPPRETAKFGKILAVAMTVALIWGILLLAIGFFVRFKFGAVLTGIIGNIDDEVNTKAAIGPTGQNLAPLGDITDDVNFGTWPKLLGALFLSSAILTILFSCLGIYSGLKHNKLILIVTVVILIVTAFLLLGLISIMADTESSFHGEAKNELIDLLQTEFAVETTNSPFIYAMNSLMLWFQCCGVSGVRDFQNLTYIEGTDGRKMITYIFKVAPACCVKYLYNTKNDPLTSYMRIKDCAIRGYSAMDQINQQGCYNLAFQDVQGTVSALLAVILIWNIFVLVLAILTIMEAKPPLESAMPLRDTEAEKSEEMMKEEREIIIKKFIPYAKISSYMHPDITRIKSTEIW